MNTMLKCLPKEVQEKLRSGVAITSLQQCVEELVLNSIDAEATCVGVRMDMDAFKVQVIDNGAGINAEDMECVGSRYYTSKCSSVEDLDNLRWYGFRGEALASVVSLASLVEFSSRCRSSVKTHVKIFKDGKGMRLFEADTTRPSAGTTVIICNFLHNMPVRRKRMDAVLEGERIRHRVEAISLMHPLVSFTLKNDCTGDMTVQLPKARNTYHRFVQIHGLGRAQKLGEISYTHGQFKVAGYIGREGHYNGSLQFLFVNHRLLLKTRIHKLLNLLLRRLSSSNQRNDSPDGHSAIRSPKHKSHELNGVYVINIVCSYSEYDICLEPAKTLIEFKDWDGILLCVEEAVKAFLSRENLVAVVSQEDFHYVPPNDQEGHNTGNNDQATSSASTLYCNIGMKLASDSVHRKRKDDCVYGDNNQECSQMECKGETEQRGKQKITTNELEEIINEEGINREYRSEPLCELEPTSDRNITEEEDLTPGEAEHGSQMLCMSSSVRPPESKNMDLSKEKEIPLNNTTSKGNVTSLDSITQPIQPHLTSSKQILPDCQCAGGCEHALESNRKISLSDPCIHENLPTLDVSQINKYSFQNHLFMQKYEKRSFASKRKISLYAGHDGTGQKPSEDLGPIIPSKIHRISACQKMSLCKETGSLEKFRRIYGKATQEPHQENNTRPPQIDSFVLKSQNLMVCQKDPQHGGVTRTEKEETQSSLKSPLTFSAFKLKSSSGQNKGGESLAAKLCQLKQHRTDDSKVLPHLSRTTSQDSTCLRSNVGSQDGNNNENHCDTAQNPDPASSCSTNALLTEREEATTSGDWLHHYDTSVGKTVYVNKVTGLSQYGDPPAEETQVCCTSDITNMAVAVISEMGMEYRCYPFQVDLVLPFLPKSRTDRVISSGLDDRGFPQTDQIVDYSDAKSTNSLKSLYSKWNNPVFVRPPMVGVDVSSEQADGLAVKIHNILFPYRFSKAMIHSMKVIHQVDKKFLACLINTRAEEPAGLPETEGNLLVLVDQHAAHERVRLENLVADSYEDDPDAPGERRLCSSTISPPLQINVTEEEQRLLSSCQAHLQSLGLEVKFSQAADPQVSVGKVPLCFIEKESNELRRGRTSVIKPIVEEYLREQIELLRSTGRVRGTLPLTVLKVLASLACHGAIKFNDSLSRDECCSLVASLSSCQLPFQCAHGRPSIAPLVDTLHLDKDEKELQKPNLQKLRRMYKAWELYGKG